MSTLYYVAVHDEIPVTEARAQFSELVNRVGFGKERIILTRHGKPLVALVPAETLPDDVPSAAATEESDPPVVLDLSSRATRPGATDYTTAARETARPPTA